MARPRAYLMMAALLLSAAAAAAPTRLPPPSMSEQAAPEKIVRELFAADFAKRTPADRTSLAQKLLSKVGVIKDDPAGSFVLLRDARELAQEANDLETALTAADRTAAAFDVNGPALKAEALAHVDANAMTAAQRKAAVPLERQLADELLASGDSAAAERVAAQALATSRSTRTPDLIASTLAWQTAFRTAADVVTRGQAAVAKLKHSKGDPELRAAAGEYDCLVKGEWNTGLPLLAEGSDAGLANLAREDLAAAAGADAVALASAADDWMAFAEKSPAFKTAVTAHAVEMYKSALPQLGGLRKLAVQKRLATLDKSAPVAREIDLLALVDLERDAYGDSTWTNENGSLVATSSSAGRIQIPYRPPAEYDFAVEYTRLSGDDAMLPLLARGDTAFAVNIGRGDHGQCWIGRINNNWGYRSDAGGQFGPMPNGVRHRAVVKVRDDGVSVFVDDKPTCAWKTDYSDLSGLPAFHFNDPTLLGFGCYRSKIVFHAVSVTEIRGRGEVLRKPPAAPH